MTNSDAQEPKLEFEAIQAVHNALVPLSEQGRTRVLSYIASLLGIKANVVSDLEGRANIDVNDNGSEGDGGTGNGVSSGHNDFSSFAELYAAASPKSNGDKALVAGYWLQICKEAGNFTAAAANKELMHLGHKVSNITDAIDTVKNHKPMLILQLKKSGQSRQARKLYKVSHEGIKRVEEMLSG